MVEINLKGIKISLNCPHKFDKVESSLQKTEEKVLRIEDEIFFFISVVFRIRLKPDSSLRSGKV
jgi:hypothetical protein